MIDLPPLPESLRDERIDGLERAIDEKLLELRETMFEGWATGHDDIEFVGMLIRAAYGKGITDSLTEPAKMRKWVKELGYRVAIRKGKG